MGTTDNTIIIVSQNNNDNSTQMMKNPASTRKVVAMNMGNMGSNISNSLSLEEVQQNDA